MAKCLKSRFTRLKCPLKGTVIKMKEICYTPKGVCSRAISFKITDDGKITEVRFSGGCSGNTKGLCALIEGMDAHEAATRLEGIKCGFKPTSCPDQLAVAIKQSLKQQ